LTREGDRFCDELGTRDYVTGEMNKYNKGPYRLILNKAAGAEIEWHCKHYIGRGLMKKFNSAAEIAKEMGIPAAKLEETFKKYNEIAKNGKDPYGKKYFHNLPLNTNEEFYVSIVTPVVHYCMGGIEINADGEILSTKGPIKGLFAAGECAGGVHGANRLGGSSLLGCVVYGRVAGDTAARYLMQSLVQSGDQQSRRIGNVASQLNGPIGVSVNVDPSQNRLGLEISWNGQTGQPSVSVTPSSGASTHTEQVGSSAAPALLLLLPKLSRNIHQKKLPSIILRKTVGSLSTAKCWMLLSL
jgi:succinate dehydrogenase/fumarate reductase flavoprotein subunit